MYLRERLDRNQKPHVRLCECVEDFREWERTRIRTAYDYSRVPDSCVSDLLQGVLGLAVTLKQVLIFNGNEFKHPPDVQNQNKRNPAVGMEKREIRKILPNTDVSYASGWIPGESVIGETYTPRNPRVMAAAGPHDRIYTPPRRLVLARGGTARCIKGKRSPPPTYHIALRSKFSKREAERGADMPAPSSESDRAGDDSVERDAAAMRALVYFGGFTPIPPRPMPLSLSCIEARFYS